MASKKLIIIIAAVVVLGGGGGGYVFMSKKKAAAAPDQSPKEDTKAAAAASSDDDEDEDEPSGGGHGEAGGPSIMAIKPIVNLQGAAKNAYLKCEIDIVFRDPELGKQASGDKPSYESSVIKSMVLTAISQLSLEEASDPEAREALRSDIKDRLNEKFAPKPGNKDKKKPKHPIKDVLVVEWAIAR
jgi:flagellar FliL protein